MSKKAIIMAASLLMALPSFGATNVKEEKSKKESTKTTICQIHAGDIGLVKYRGGNYEEAFEKVTNACFSKRNDAYRKSRNEEPDQDRQISFVESCVNDVKCI